MTNNSRSRDDLVGSVIQDRYRVISKIGEGGMGVVYRAEHLLIGRHFAIKTLHPTFTQEQQVVARFHREARAAAAIGNEHIIEVSDMGYLPNGSPYLVMELLEGNNLSEELEYTGPLPISRAMKIAIQCSQALAEAHKKGIVHRDIKPENIFLKKRDDGSDFVKILDFGISKIRESALGINDGLMTKTGSAIGTPYYMSPEQASGDKAIDARTDIYAMGVVLFQMLIGRVPFDAPTFPMLILKIMQEPPPSMLDLRSDVPVSLLDVTNRALAKEPEQRFGSMAELIDALFPFTDLDGEPRLTDPGVRLTQTDTPRAWEGETRPPKASRRPFSLNRKTYLAGTLAAAVVLAGLILVVIIYPEHGSDQNTQNTAAVPEKKSYPESTSPQTTNLGTNETSEIVSPDQAPENSIELTENTSVKSIQETKPPVAQDAKSAGPSRTTEILRSKKERSGSRRRHLKASKPPPSSSDLSAPSAETKPTANPPAPALRRIVLDNKTRATVQVTLNCVGKLTTTAVSGKSRVSVEVPEQDCRVKCTGVGRPSCQITLRAQDPLVVIH